MNALDFIKAMYELSGGDSAELDGLSNKDPNMISAIYGDGLNTKLPNEVVDTVGEWLAEQGDSDDFISNVNSIPIYYSTTKADSDGSLGYIFNEYHNTVDYGLSEHGHENESMGWESLLQVIENSPYILICHATLDGDEYLLPASATYTNPETINSSSDRADVYWACLVNTRHSTRETTPTTLTFGCSFVNDGGEVQV